MFYSLQKCFSRIKEAFVFPYSQTTRNLFEIYLDSILSLIYCWNRYYSHCCSFLLHNSPFLRNLLATYVNQFEKNSEWFFLFYFLQHHQPSWAPSSLSEKTGRRMIYLNELGSVQKAKDSLKIIPHIQNTPKSFL